MNGYRDNTFGGDPPQSPEILNSPFQYATRQGSQGLCKLQKSVRHPIPLKTTLNLNDALLTDAKALAAQHRTSLTQIIEEGLQLRLRAQTNQAKPRPLPVHRGRGGLAPGLNALSNRAMLEAADNA